MIYKALIKYGYSSFKLDILEYCTSSVLISREQYYFDNLNPDYNILKIAGSIKGFKHSEASIELMRLSKLGRGRTKEAKLKISANSVQAYLVIVTDKNTGKCIEFGSIRKASEFIGKHHSYVAKCIKNNNFYKNEEFTITVQK